MIKKFNLLVFFIVTTLAVQAQKPSLHALHGNATLIEYHKNKAKSHATQVNNRTQSTATATLSLPFFDEFSYAGPFPDSTRWLNSQSVFVNHTKAMAPPTLGVATFDGLNKYGYPYNPSAVSNTNNNLPTVGSDTLLSAPIRLDSIPLSQEGLSPSDSVYLSFYYQGRGFWEKPDQGDYLSLDFYSPSDTTWSTIWTHDGYLYDPDSSWHLVMIPILDTSYFHNGFQFRFSNLSGGSGDADHWHIDEVYLNNNRTIGDTMFSSIIGAGSVFSDVSFVYDLQSPLKNYSQMPFKQYIGASDMKTNIGTFLRCDFSTYVSLATHYNFSGASGIIFNSPTPDPSNNLYNYRDSGYCKDPALINPSLNGFAYPHPLTSTDSSFTMKFFVSTTLIDNIPENDTITFHQKFSNYYAYDDGSAESGFGIDPGGTGNYQTAARFVTNVADTLRAMDIFFDPVIDVTALKSAPFNILVWANKNGMPGNIIYTDSLRYIYFPADSIGSIVQRENTMMRYQFKSAVPISAGDTFFLGINQIYDSPEITVGFDRNTDFHNNMFYNADGVDWYVFPGDLDPDYLGSLMIHPVFGDSLQTVSINRINAPSANISLYPNPASDYVYIQSDDIISKIIITDLLGNVVLQQADNSIKKINTLSLPSGVYFIKTFTDKGFTDTKKFIIAK